MIEMWIPDDVAELEKAVTQGLVEESACLDFKREISSKTRDVARDVAAMANEGGVLIFGVGEDELGRPSILKPIQLVGQAERISEIIRTGISDAPTVEIKTLTLAHDPAHGYLVVIIPPSPRAPHMVVLGGDNRFYGRSARGNVPLNDAEIARLYARRNNHQVDNADLLGQVIESASIEPNSDFGYLHLVARPSMLMEDLLLGLSGSGGGSSILLDAIKFASRMDVFPYTFSPGFSTGTIRPTPNGWIIYMHDQPSPGQKRQELYVLDLEVRFDGTIRLFCGRAAERRDSLLQIFDSGVAETTVRFLSVTGYIYQEIKYLGSCDLGVAVTGISGAISHTVRMRLSLWNNHTFEDPDYRRIIQVSSPKLLQDTRAVARSLLSRFFHATSGGRFDPLE